MGPVDADCDALSKAMVGLGTSERVLTEIIITATNAELEAIKACFFCIQNEGICIEMMDFALSMWNFVSKNEEFCIENDGFCIINEEFCIKKRGILY